MKAGDSLGPYRLVSELGAGGMGEVYRARDAKLNREVAIKVLPASLAQDPAALARFEREAQAVAALSHPNILAIHDFGAADGVTYAVMELLEGETLRARLAGGALAPRKAIDVGVHIVRGIAAAHGRGIVHRDLKPENIFLTKDGVVKILDFGLAKAAEPDATARMAGETRITADTTPGTVLGTVGYMSPEQVRAAAVDHRTDIFSFGAILYEMLTGRRAFSGGSQVETMNAILKEDPPEFAEISPTLPSSLDRIVRRCMEKDPNDRFHSAHDLAIALEALSGASSQSAASIAARATAAPPKRRIPLPVAALAILLVAAGAFFAGRGFSTSEPPTVTEFQRLTYRRGPIQSARIAPGGTTFIYSAAWDGTPLQLYSTRSESPESMPLPYVNADVVSISGTGELALISNRRNFNAFARPGTLSRAPLSGGASRDVLEDVQHADWLPDGSNLAVSHLVNGRYQLEFPIGKVVYETTGWISQLSVSRDGRRVAFLDQPLLGDDRGGVSIVDASGVKKALPVQCESAQGIGWGPGDREVWFTCASKGLWRALMAATPDGQVRTLLRVPGTMILGEVAANGDVLLTHDSARRGAVGLAPGDKEPRDLSWLDWSQPAALSEDGRTLLFTEEGEGGGPGYGAFLRKLDGSQAVRLGTGEALALSPDGKWAIVQKLDPAPMQLLLMPTGAGQSRALTADDITHILADFLPDGKRFVFIGFKPDRPRRTWVQPIDGGAATPVTPEGVAGLLVTPDGRKVMARGADGQRRLYAIDSPDSAPEPVRGLEPGDGMVRFAADGRGLLVRRPSGGGAAEVIRVDLASGARKPVRTIAPMPGTGDIGQLLVTSDASAYVYGYGVTHSDLFLVKGLK